MNVRVKYFREHFVHIILVGTVATPNGCYNLKRNDYNSESKTEKAWISRSCFTSLFFSVLSHPLEVAQRKG